MQVDQYGVKESQIIRRYIDLPKLIDLVLGNEVFFPTLQSLTALDPFECGIIPHQQWKNLKRDELESKAMTLRSTVPSNLLTGDRVEDFNRYENLVKVCSIKELRQHVAELHMLLLKGRIVCNCWHADASESDAMWKIYSKGSGVMLESTVGKLKSSIVGQYSNVICSPNPQSYQIAPVRYENTSRPINLPKYYVEHPWLLKRKSFAHEKEIRISHQIPWVIGPKDGGMLVRVTPDKLITRILLSPFMERWERNSIISVIEMMLLKAKIEIPVLTSDHANAPKRNSRVLNGLDFLHFRDSINGGWHSIKAYRESRTKSQCSLSKPKAGGTKK